MILTTFDPLLQSNYGGSLDCTLTSITACIHFYRKDLAVDDIYFAVEKYAKQRFYESEKLGTMPFFINYIYTNAMKYFNIPKSSKGKYLRGCYKFKDIKQAIDRQTPVVLSVWKLGKYKDHTITVVGYEGEDTIFIYDNWDKDLHRFKFSEISLISSINWAE